ncbi:hypothetical protein NDK50_15480 [Paraburkholderia bryophila]|uniref:hypothetical protein n=1 Tax=Paraburkholderia bryophila TaxID=420952 RepID=UPI00234A5773|nr:hypothetical protein [Paraburkholderia bryophila]WCM18826.1 hypothetical protein NDK50_15480 [Paraburkholderia bryophila]
MKKSKKRAVNKQVVLGTGLALLLSACGGGTSGGSGSTSNSANLSAVQQNYESAALAANGGLHYVSGALSFTTSSTGVLSISSNSTFYSDDSSVAQSPANGAQMLSVSYSSVSSALRVPTLAVDRLVTNGAVASTAMPPQVRVSYNGANVQEDYLAADGKTTLRTVLGTSYTVVPLTGLISASPAELFTNSGVGLITNTVNGQALYNTQATWQTGAAYVKVVRQYAADTLYAYDCVAPATTGNTPTPCSATISTLEGFFPYTSTTDGKTYQLGDGQIVTVAGVRAWVANAQLGGATTDYRVYYQSNGGISAGYLIRSGTTLQITPLGGGTPQSNAYFLNGAALGSLKSAISF